MAAVLHLTELLPVRRRKALLSSDLVFIDTSAATTLECILRAFSFCRTVSSRVKVEVMIDARRTVHIRFHRFQNKLVDALFCLPGIQM